jgi:hydroxymethylpyrimidine/phosphomethylpyrimidine kinase
MSDSRVALTIAGSDSGGGAGIQADLKTFHQFGVFGTSALSAVTAQNTIGVTAIHLVPPAILRAQLDAVFTDLRPDAAKTGMLGTKDHIRTVVRCLEEYRFESLVVDPVMVATSGDRLLEADARISMAEELVPRATVVTPNIPEAEELVGDQIASVDDMIRVGEKILRLGARAVLITGGHHAGDSVQDVYVDPEGVKVFARPRLNTTSTHGTGCTLSAAIAACLARGETMRRAVERAGNFVHRAIANAPCLGSGNGPVNHLVDPGIQ